MLLIIHVAHNLVFIFKFFLDTLQSQESAVKTHAGICKFI